jgi:hypothetical protein
MLYPQNSQNASTQRSQTTPRSAEVRRIARITIMVVRLSASSEDTWGLKGNNNAKPTATPHQRNTVMVKQTRGSWDELAR